MKKYLYYFLDSEHTNKYINVSLRFGIFAIGSLGSRFVSEKTIFIILFVIIILKIFFSPKHKKNFKLKEILAKRRLILVYKKLYKQKVYVNLGAESTERV
jgi:hypothetical protein